MAVTASSIRPRKPATEFAGQLAGALQVAASDVKVQVEFNPQRVTAYRQIGYAKHQLTKEQFRDNTVDAAEIAAQEAGNALYTVEVNPARRRAACARCACAIKIPGTADYREQEWAVPYTGNAVALEQASPAMRLAATASAFSEWLVSSPFAGEVTPDRLLELPERRAGSLWRGRAPEETGMDDPAGEEHCGEMKSNHMKFLKQILIVACVTLAASITMAQTESENILTGDWAVLTNNPIQGLSLRARLVNLKPPMHSVPGRQSSLLSSKIPTTR